MIEAAVAEGVAYIPGGPFFVDGTGANTMRLTFAKEDIPTIQEGVKRLARAVKASLP
jgi:2-aminoadipate transaminase